MLHKLFETQVEKTPDSTALVFQRSRLTYRELNAKANQLAYQLHALDIAPEARIGIYCDRSLEMVIGLLAVLKAGCAYVPLDPSYPKERLAFMLSDSQVAVLLTQESLVATFSEHQARFICLDMDWQLIDEEHKMNLNSDVRPDHLAYVIYTSGSTGQPKGVMMNHQGICNGILWLQETYPLTADDRILQKTPISFDISTWEIFWPLVCGACIVMAKPGGHHDSQYLLELISQEKITVMHIVPSMLQVFLEEFNLNSARLGVSNSLRHIFSAGEMLPFALRSRFFECMPNSQLHDIYGATETFAVTYWDCQQQEETRNFSIGYPITNLPIHILDEQMQPVPPGEVGELYVGGGFLARGYLNRPEITAERFVLNSIDPAVSKYLYKTGDLARYCPDGAIEHLGRADQQVKISGFRVELGEIEGELEKHGSIKRAVVIPRNDVSDNLRLFAYCVLKTTKEANAAVIPELRKFLQRSLPHYMIPSGFIFLDKLPITPNGKVDRKALPKPDQTRPHLEQEFLAPRNSLESQLADIWGQLLGFHPVGVNDNFFEIGGSSLLAIRSLTHIRQKFQIDFPIDVFLERPTIANIAHNIELFSNSEVPEEQGLTVRELIAEVSLDLAIQPSIGSGYSVSSPNTIFLTGVTGFLGAFLLCELLEQTHATVYCLVRGCETPVQARQKIQLHLERYLLEYERFSSRIVPVIGDLSKPLLGLNEQNFGQLAEEIDVVYHTAAALNSAYPYAALRAVNVGGTKELLKLASRTRLKPFHFISSPAVFESSGYLKQPLIQENADLNACEVVYGGYSQSKWVGEQLVRAAHLQGLQICVYRPGMISGHSQTGVSDTEQILARLIKSFIQQGIAPDLDIAIDMTPVSYVSQAVVYLSRQQELQGRIFNLINPRSLHLRDLIKVINSLGHPLEQIQYSEWETRMNNNVLNASENVLSDLLPILTTKIPRTQITSLESSFSIISRLDCEGTVKELAEASISCPPVDAQLLHAYISYFERNHEQPILSQS